MQNLKLQAPWTTYRNKIAAIFENDPDITVGSVESGKNGIYNLDIEVRNHQKYLALRELMIQNFQLGNVTLVITLYDEENTASVNEIEAIKTIFKNNPIVKDIKITPDLSGTTDIGYVRFVPEVIQFFNDDTSDYNGNYNGLAEDIARELFSVSWNVNFCTAAKNKN